MKLGAIPGGYAFLPEARGIFHYMIRFTPYGIAFRVPIPTQGLIGWHRIRCIVAHKTIRRTVAGGTAGGEKITRNRQYKNPE